MLKKMIFQWMSVLCTVVASLQGQEIWFQDATGEIYNFDVDEEESFLDVKEKISLLSDAPSQPLIFEVRGHSFCKYQAKQGDYLGYPRNYYQEPDQSNKDDIFYIVHTLANDSLISIKKAQQRLNDAGERINKLHPFKFLMVIFTSDQLKVDISNLRTRFYWSKFTEGLKNSLNSEASIDNLRQEYVDDFARKVGISPHIIINSILGKDWDNFLDLLIQHVPRDDGDRYDT